MLNNGQQFVNENGTHPTSDDLLELMPDAFQIFADKDFSKVGVLFYTFLFIYI